MNIQIKNRYSGNVIFETDVKNIGQAVAAALKIKISLSEADLHWADLSEADLHWADLSGANLYGADLHRADLHRADLHRADLIGSRIKSGKVFSGLYKYITMAILMPDGTRIVKMGCLEKTLEEWDAIGIRKSNPNEFPDNGSEASEERVLAFEFTKATALALK